MTKQTQDDRLRLLSFVWDCHDSGAPEFNGPRRGWFAFFEKAGCARRCSRCTSPVTANDPCWVNGEGGFVLCSECAEAAEELEVRRRCPCCAGRGSVAA